jgi:radical SAM protein with 4Fe4S-binding SPASM domain
VPAPGPLQRLLWPVIRGLELRARVLRYLFLEVTQRCNLACRHCGSDCKRETRPGELTTDEWLTVLKQLSVAYDREELLLVLTGGEPLCMPGWDRVEAALEENGSRWGLVSNGWDLDGARARSLCAHGVETVTVSLDGLETSHDWLRGRKGSFDRAVSAIRHVREAGVPVFDVVTCVGPRNVGELPEVSALLQGLGVKRWRLFSIFPRGRAKGREDLVLSAEGMKRLMAFVRDERRRVDRDHFLVEYCCEGYLPPRLDAQVRDSPYFCRAGINIASILCDGAISACPNIPRTLVQGSIREDDFREVWEKRFQPFRDRSWMRVGPCKTCAEWPRCQGNSMHLWDEEAGCTSRCHVALLRDHDG